MKTDSADALHPTPDRVANPTAKLEEPVVAHAARLHVSVAELQAYTFKNGDAAFLCSPPPAPKAD